MAAMTTEQLLQQQQVLQTEVERLRKDLQRKEADLRLATSALLAIHNGTKLQDLVEMNLALDEQVKSLKKMVQMMQSQSTSDRASTLRRSGVRRSTETSLPSQGDSNTSESVSSTSDGLKQSACNVSSHLKRLHWRMLAESNTSSWRWW